MIYAVADRRTLRFTCASAGHPPPLWRRSRTGDVQTLPSRGPILGVSLDPLFEEASVQLQPGDLVLLHTDGLIECQSSGQEAFGRERVEDVLRRHGGDSGEAMLGDLSAELEAFRGTHPLEDDVTSVALAVQPA